MPTPQDTTSSLIEQAWRLVQQQQPGQALKLAQQVLAIEPGNISAVACRAVARWATDGHNADSLADLQRAVEAAPGVSALRHNYGTLLAEAGQLEAAAAQYRTALQLQPRDARAFWGLATNTRMSGEGEMVAAMERLADDPSLSAVERQFLSYGLAKACDDLGRYEQALRYATEANHLAGRNWNPAQLEATVAEVRALAAADAFRGMKRSGHPSQAPLFIVGMPRSGTTLIETILSRHPDVVALGESKQIVEVHSAAMALRRPGMIDVSAGLGRDWLKARAEALVRGWSGSGRKTFALVTDKMPDNAYALGLIAQLFPRGRVIYARRHPLDTGVSNFLTRYAEGQGFATRLDWIGIRSRLTAEVMDVWKQALDLPILDVHYERLVAEPDKEIRRIADFAGLAWTDDFLTPEQAARAARTASRWQVQQPIYRSSVGRWRHYEPWLGPMIEAMGGMDWIAAQATGA